MNLNTGLIFPQAIFQTKNSGEMLLASVLQHCQHPPQTLKGSRRSGSGWSFFTEHLWPISTHTEERSETSALIFPHLFEAAKNPEVRSQNPYREKKRIISEKNASERDLSSEIWQIPNLRTFFLFAGVHQITGREPRRGLSPLRLSTSLKHIKSSVTRRSISTGSVDACPPRWRSVGVHLH